MSFENFFAAVDQLGETREQQAQALDMTSRGLQKLRKGKIPRWLTILVTKPELLDALARDARKRPRIPAETP